MDSDKIKKFWNNRAQQCEQGQSFSITNLEENDELQILKVRLELEHISRLLDITPDMKVLDLGAGVGAWSLLFAAQCKKVVAVEYSDKMLKIAKQIAKDKLVDNIDFVCRNVLDYRTSEKYDIIFCSGLLLYLDDVQIGKLLTNITGYSKKGTILLLREPAGIQGRYEIVNKYSETLKAYYSALYRTSEEYINLFKRISYSHVYDEDMFEAGSPLNKWKETRLRVYVFEYTGK